MALPILPLDRFALAAGQFVYLLGHHCPDDTVAALARRECRNELPPHPHRVYVRAERSAILPAAWFIAATIADDR